MTAPPLKGGARACASKRRYCDQYAARAAASDAINREGSNVTELWVYSCRLCRGWHLTRNNNGIRYKVSANEIMFDPIKKRGKNVG